MCTSPYIFHLHLNTPLFPAGLSTHLVPSSCASDSTLANYCTRLQIMFTHLLYSLGGKVFYMLAQLMNTFIHHEGSTYIQYSKIKRQRKREREKKHYNQLLINLTEECLTLKKTSVSLCLSHAVVIMCFKYHVQNSVCKTPCNPTSVSCTQISSK